MSEPRMECEIDPLLQAQAKIKELESENKRLLQLIRKLKIAEVKLRHGS